MATDHPYNQEDEDRWTLREEFLTHDDALDEVVRLRGVIARNKQAFTTQHSDLVATRQRLKNMTKARDELYALVAVKPTSKPGNEFTNLFGDLFGNKR